MQPNIDDAAPAGGALVLPQLRGLQPFRLEGVSLPLDVLTALLVVSLWMASGSLVLAVTEGLGSHPTRRACIGGVLVLACLAALLGRRAVGAALWHRPWLVLPIAATQLGLATLDGLVGGPYVAFSLTSIGIAVIAAPPRLVWLCVATLCAGYLAIALVEYSPSGLTSDGRLSTVLGAVIGYVAAAVPLMLLRQRFTRMTQTIDAELEDMRHGSAAFTPELAAAIARARPALPPGRPRLTPAERRVVAALARGMAPKQMAHEWGLSIATIRTHIKNAKRKTGARTLPQLAASAVEHELA